MTHHMNSALRLMATRSGSGLVAGRCYPIPCSIAAPAFTPEQRQLLGLQGLLPSGVTTLEGQLRRVYAQYRRQSDDLAKNVSWPTCATATRCCSTGCWPSIWKRCL